MKKKILLTLIALLMLIIPTSFAEATKVVYPVNIYVDGLYLYSPDAQPYIDSNGRSMIPLRAVSDSLGATSVTWDAKTYTAKVVLGDKTVELQVGKNYGIVNGVKQEFDTITIVSNGRTFVPLRFVSESLGYKIGYKFGKDPQAGNKPAHIITIGNITGTLPVMVDMGWKNTGLTSEQADVYYSMFKKIPAGSDISQVMVMGRSFYMSRNVSDGTSFNWIYIISYEQPGYISVGIRELVAGWDEFTINSLTALLGSDGTVIGTQMVKDIMGTYNASENVYYASRLNGKTITSGKYTYSYSDNAITWKE